MLSGDSKRLQELFVFASLQELVNMPLRATVLGAGRAGEGQPAPRLPHPRPLLQAWSAGVWHRGTYPPVPWCSACPAARPWGQELASLHRLAESFQGARAPA